MAEANFASRTLYVMDNLRVLRGMDSGSVDLIATDPPFNSKRSFNAPLGSKAARQKFDDRWRWDEVTDEWHDLIGAGHPRDQGGHRGCHCDRRGDSIGYGDSHRREGQHCRVSCVDGPEGC